MRRTTHFYKSYPIYGPGKEPPGYQQWLKKQEPEELNFDFANCKTPEDWSRIGAIIFEAPLRLANTWNGADLSDPVLWRQLRLPVAADGTLPYARYAIRKKGEIEITDGGCVLCHARVLPDGSILKGA